MTQLEPKDFVAFFEAVHHHPPFPWQERLLRQVAERGRWPELLDLPTGTGKTAAIDVAVFWLALEAERPNRRAPSRIVLVVDRRTIVDQAYRRARAIADALRAASDSLLSQSAEPVVAEVARRLSALSRERKPLHVALLRGGIARDDAWARSPEQPVVAVSTVDQVGSRLLFRGYGVSDSMKPVHAGLLGNDVLYLLDEVHLSRPFAETLDAVRRYRSAEWVEAPLPDRLAVVRMSATSLDAGGGAFRLDEQDEANAVLRKRLDGRKPVTLHEIKVSGEEADRRSKFAAELSKLAEGQLGPGRVIGVVVNRVQTARDVHARLQAKAADRFDVELLTGRMRPIDRAQLEAHVAPRIEAGRRRDPAQRPIVVVATQCIEAGADFDFDALITECAALDALRQRFGRLDRLGELGTAPGVVVVRSDALGKDAGNDPIYGEALAETWAWLREQSEPDFGLRRLPLPAERKLTELTAPAASAPIMLPAHLDAWVQTAPIPEPDPDVSLWLHGPERGLPEVQIVWRADVTAEHLARARDADDALAALQERIELCPPSSGEALAVPLHAAIRWLERRDEVAFGDVEAARPPDEERRREGNLRPVFVWRGDASFVPSATGERRDRRIRPGDTLVVPSTYGGLSAHNWDPAANEPVPDLGDLACLVQRGRAVLRLDDRVVAAAVDGDAERAAALTPPRPSGVEEAEDEDEEQARAWLRSVASHADAPLWLQRSAEHLANSRRARLVRMPAVLGPQGEELSPAMFAWIGRARLRVDPSVVRIATGAGLEATSEVVTEGDAGSFSGVEITLREHLGGVAAVAADLARRCGLPREVARDLELAAKVHDLGKIDPRFQRMLRGGSEFKAMVAPEPIAKSSAPPGDRRARALAAERSGYPTGARHELASLALVQADEQLRAEAHDWDLVLHLVASHHGHCRPFAPWVEDREPVTLVHRDGERALRASSAHGLERLDSGVSARFLRMVGRYGWFGLAWLEAILRLADHRRSEEEQRKGDA